MEHLLEKSISKEKTKKDNAIMLVTVLLTIALSVGVLFIEPIATYFPLFYLIFWYGAYRMIVSRSIEYEYGFVENHLTIDQITNRKWRKRLFNASLDDFEVLDLVTDEQYDDRIESVTEKIYAVSTKSGDDQYFGLIQYGNKKVVLYMELDDEMIEYINDHSELDIKY